MSTNKNNLSISSLISPHPQELLLPLELDKKLQSSFYDPKSNTLTASPFVDGRETEVIVLDDEDDVILVGETKHNKHEFLKQLQQQPPVQSLISTTALPFTPVQLQKSTKVSLMSMMNSDNSTAPTTTPLEKAAAPVKKAETKPKLVRKPRAKKVIAPSHDLNTTIIIDGKPVVIPAIAPAQRTTDNKTDSQPPKKRAKKDTTTAATNGEKKPAKPATKRVTKPKLSLPLLSLLLLPITNAKTEDSSSIIPLAPSPLPPVAALTKAPIAATNGKASTLNIPAKSIKRGPKPKTSNSDTVTVITSLPPPVENEPTPIKTLDPPKLADVKVTTTSQANLIASPSPLTAQKGPSKPEIDRLDPLAAKKVVEPAVEEPIISLHIPLVTPDQPPGSAQVIFNVTKLCEDKYGWKAIHPGAKFAIDELNEDDDMEDMEDDDELDEAEKLKREKEKEIEKEKEKEEEKPKKKELSFEAKMNRKIGKYDYEDPFIDDAELLWDEQHVSTKDGFFVYYGPLFEEGQNPRIEKLDNKSRGGGSRSSTQRSTTALSSNGKPLGNPNRGNNGRFASNGLALVITTKSPSVENATDSVDNGGNNPKSLVAIQPKSRMGTPPVKLILPMP